MSCPSWTSVRLLLALSLALAGVGGAGGSRMVCEEYRPCLFPGQEPPTLSDEALRNISELLLEADAHNAAKHIALNYQSHVRAKRTPNEPLQPLMKLNSTVFQIPNVAKVQKMFDNYIADSTIREKYTEEDEIEQNDLLLGIINTRVMAITFDYLATHGIVTRDLDDFRNVLLKTWFLLYPRSNKTYGSSAFEHIFLAELNNGTISGMHNWIFFSALETNKTANYMGYIKKIQLGTKGDILKIRYKWGDIVKRVGSIFVGTSPELEMALYTICFLNRADRPCRLSLANHHVTIRTRSIFRMNTKYMTGASLSI